MRIYVIAGEASGDLHGANLLKALKRLDDGLEVRAWGGDRMEAQGAHLVRHFRDLAFMGFAEVVRNLRTILDNIAFCKRDILAWAPDAVVLIDYPGFNLRIAEFCHQHGIKVFYYISPQVWAWKKGRVRTIRKVVDRMFVILPFEKDWYAQHGMEVDFVGHPLLDAIEEEGRKPLAPLPGDDGRPVVAVLPGSRRQEIAGMLPIMLRMVRHFPSHRFVVGAAPSVDKEFLSELIGDSGVSVVEGRTYDLIRSADAAIVTSGTATLETALFGVPEVVCYKGSRVNVAIARWLVKVPFISLVNLIMGEEVVRELIQDDLNEKELRFELDRLLNDEAYRRKMRSDLADLLHRLGGPGASATTASLMWKSLHDKG